MGERWDAVVLAEDVGGWLAAADLARRGRCRVVVAEPPRRSLEVLPPVLPELALGWFRPPLHRRLEKLLEGLPRQLAPTDERLVFPDLTLPLRVGRSAWAAELRGAFPRAGRAIREAVRVTRRASVAGRVGEPSELFDRWLEAHIADPRLLGVLGARWAGVGRRPEQLTLAEQAMAWRSFVCGGTELDLDRLQRAACAEVESLGGAWRSGPVTIDNRGLSVDGARFEAPIRIDDRWSASPPPRESAPPRWFVLQTRLERPIGRQLTWLHRQWSQKAMGRELSSVYDGRPQHAALRVKDDRLRVLAPVPSGPPPAYDLAPLKAGLQELIGLAHPDAEPRAGSTELLPWAADDERWPLRFDARSGSEPRPEGWIEAGPLVCGFAGAVLGGLRAADRALKVSIGARAA